MSLHHVASGEVTSLAPLGELTADTKTHTLAKTPSLEVIRLVLPAGKKIPEHHAPGEITVHCLEGRVVFSVGPREHFLIPGDWLYLDAAQPHALLALEDSSLLVTMLLCARIGEKAN